MQCYMYLWYIVEYMSLAFASFEIVSHLLVMLGFFLSFDVVALIRFAVLAVILTGL